MRHSSQAGLKRVACTPDVRHGWRSPRCASVDATMDRGECTGRCMIDAPLRSSAAGAPDNMCRNDHESHSPGSGPSRHWQPVARGMRAATICKPVFETIHLASVDQDDAGTIGVVFDTSSNVDAAGQHDPGAILERRQPEGGRRQDTRQPDRTRRTTSTRAAGSARGRGGSPAGQDLAISKGRMQFEPFPVSGCPDQEIRNADL